ncbi:ADP-ribosylglycohydrolase family protein [Marinobacter sp. LV10R520-4]|uniref:ADP-ribosylglycohydrolase family protein n=1 Tax=Marinobacter sp. LV10R520-4 TaxID=1761796 RepID=UPI000BF45F78|nr:ADP-ribosylglycohydrolase family protein [Marinobacter sp. LV10R520-4]
MYAFHNKRGTRINALAGGWVADAASLGLHWLYDSLLASEGALDIRDCQRRFLAFFGPGGLWQGYIDNPTRVTLNNLNTIEQKAIEQAQSTTTAELTGEPKRVLVQEVLPYTRRLSGGQLAAPVRKAIGLTYQEPEIQKAGVHLARTIDRHLLPESGADDMQLPAVSKLPPLW